MYSAENASYCSHKNKSKFSSARSSALLLHLISLVSSTDEMWLFTVSGFTVIIGTSLLKQGL